MRETFCLGCDASSGEKVVRCTCVKDAQDAAAAITSTRQDFDENHSQLTGRAPIAGAPTWGGAGMLAFGSRAFISPNKASASFAGAVSAGA